MTRVRFVLTALVVSVVVIGALGAPAAPRLLSQQAMKAALPFSKAPSVSLLPNVVAKPFGMAPFQGGGNPCLAPANAIVAENCLTGNPSSQWQITASGSTNIQGFATNISVNKGTTVSFKVKTNPLSNAWHIDIYRLGYYQGNGARKVATINPSVTLPQSQPTCLSDAATGLVDCGNWAVSASWNVPSTAVSGLYLGKLVRDDATAGSSHMAFIVRDDASHSDIVFQTSDTTWQAYNDFQGQSLYTGTPAGRAYKVSYNRPFVTADAEEQSWIFDSEHPMIRWLEANGFDMTYITGVDSDRFGTLIKNHKAFFSVGHDEYWSGAQRANVESALATGVNLAFFSGNEVSWKTRWENSIDSSHTTYRTLVCYKETASDAKIDPTDTWTGTWRDPRFSPPADGGRPENGLSGTISTVNGFRNDSIVVPDNDGRMRFWRNTGVDSQLPGDAVTFAAGTLGYEWDEDLDNGARPAGLFRLSTNTVSGVETAIDFGGGYVAGSTATHHMTMYKAGSGARVFSSGSVQWSWGLDPIHTNADPPADLRIQQATVNLLADMGVQPANIQLGLAAASASADTTPPTTTIVLPAGGSSLPGNTPVAVAGTASDVDGHVAGVEVSIDAGATWHPAIGRESWVYIFDPATGPVSVISRAVDDSGNIGPISASRTFTALNSSDTTRPTVTSVSPTSGATGVLVSTTVRGVFSESLDPGSVTKTNVELKAGTTSIAGGVTYDAVNKTVVFTPRVPLAYSTVYTATLHGGTTGLKDAAGNTLLANFTWSFTTQAQPPPPDSGPGGPILVIGSLNNPFGRYLGEVLQTEGLNEFTVTDLSFVTASRLSGFDVVVLGENTLTSAQAAMFTSYVQNGGTLIAMRPDNQLSALLGITNTGTTLTDAYLLVNGTGPGAGIVNQTIQYHGLANRYTLNGATSLATLYSNSTTATTNPAVTSNNVGSGHAIAFAYDLAKSIIYTRQGNPAWSGQNRDGLTPNRSDDLFFGASPTDPKPDWVDFSKIQIPQADEQQRFLANIIRLADSKPLPSFWYFPNMKKAAVVMTGDDHANGGTSGRFDHYAAISPAGCSVANWECIRSTSYVYVSQALSAAQAASYTAQGFEVGLHLFTGCLDFTAASLDQNLTDQLNVFKTTYFGLQAPNTNRTHCIPWSDYDTQPQVELAHGIRLDTNYYYYPDTWVNDRPGMFTGSGMPMRFSDRNGNIINVFQAPTQMTDESNQDYPLTSDSLLANAVGPLGYYGAFTANMHTDDIVSAAGDAIVSSATQRGVPVVSARQMLNWLDGRNSSSFTGFTWDGFILTFNVSLGANTTGINALVPASNPVGPLTGILFNGNPITYSLQTIKGLSYATFPAAAGTYKAVYQIDIIPPSIVSRTPAANATGVAVDSSIAVQFTKPLDPTTVNNTTFRLREAGASADFPAGVSFSGVTATLKPSQSMRLGAGYTVTVSGAVKDLAGNQLGADSVWSFTTSSSAAFTDTTVADFTAGTLDANTVVLQEGDGEVALNPSLLAPFTGTSLPAGWTSTPWNSGGVTTVGAGVASVDGARLGTTAAFATGRSLEFTATFSGAPYQHAGFGTDFNGPPWAMFSSSSGGGLFMRTNSGSSSADVQVPGNWFGTPHRYRVDWSAGSITYFIDGTQVGTQPIAIATQMRPLFSDYNVGAGGLNLDWVRLGSYAGSSTFLSRTFDAGGPAVWSSASWNAVAPAGTSLNIAVRVGNSPAPDGNWSNFQAASNGGAISLASRYLQYRVQLGTTSLTTPILQDITLNGVNNNGSLPTISISDTSVVESQTSSTVAHFNVTLSGSSSQATSVHFATADGTAVAGTDYTATSGTLTIPAGSTSGGIDVTVIGHALAQQSANFFVNLTTPVNGLLLRGQGTGTIFNAPDLTPPSIISKTPDAGVTGVATNAVVTVNFSEALSPATVNGSTVRLRAAGASTDVAATVAYNGGTTVTLTPASSLSLAKNYTVTVAGTITDLAANPLGGDVTWTFTTTAAQSLTDTTLADFSAGTIDANGYLSQTGNGEVMLAPSLLAEFNGTSLPAGFTSDAWNPGGATTVANGVVTVDGSRLNYANLTNSGVSLEFSANFSTDGYQHVGFGVDFNSAPWAIFSTMSGNQLAIRVNDGSNAVDTPIAGNWLGAFHLYRIEWNPTNVVFYIDGNQVGTIAANFTQQMRPLVSDYSVGGNPVVVDWLRLSPYATPSTFNSRVFDGGDNVTWTSLAWTASTPAGTAIGVSIRTGNTPTPDASWTAFTPVTSGGAINTTARYLQYQAVSSTTNAMASPSLQSVTVNYNLPVGP